MTRSEIEAKVKKVICDQLGTTEDEVKEDSNFIEDLWADSLDLVELAMVTEEEFEIEVPDEELENVKTFKDAVDFVEKKLTTVVPPGGVVTP